LLPQLVLTLGPARRFARSLDRRQQKRNEDANNGDDDQ
jgi:hypothetical protein